MENTPDYKMQAAAEAMKLIRGNQTIGLGAGTSVAHLAGMIAADKDLNASLVLTSSSFKTTDLLRAYQLNVRPPAYVDNIDIYFDGCDQFDRNLNAFKSGGGIHTTEKILASMAREFILLGDAGKMTDQLDAAYPLVIEILPPALPAVLKRLEKLFPGAALNLRTSDQKDGAVISEYGNYLLNVQFTVLPGPELLNNVKMIPGVVDHSLFYGMATGAIIAGAEGIMMIRSGLTDVHSNR